MKVYVNRNLIFDGQLDRGGGEAPADQSMLVGPGNEETEGAGSHTHAWWEESRGGHRTAGTGGDQEPGAARSEPAGAAVGAGAVPPGHSLGEGVNSPDHMEDSLSTLEGGFGVSAAPALTGGVPSAPPSQPLDHPPLGQGLSLIQQLENLTGRKVSEPPGKTPSWLQPSPTGKGRKPKPLWLSPEKPQDWKDRLRSEDLCSEGSGEAGDRGLRREHGRASGRNVISGERAQRVAAKVCSDDLDIFDQPSHRGRPASGRRGLKKDALGSGHGDGRGKPGRKSDWLPPPLRGCRLAPSLFAPWTLVSSSARGHKFTVSAGRSE